MAGTLPTPSSHLFVRKGETRFKKLSDFNSPDVTFVVMDGEATVTMVPRFFPKAKVYALPGMAPVSDRFLAVIGNKADVTITDLSMGMEFIDTNPGKLELFPSKPLETTSSVILLQHGQQELKNFLDAGIAALREKGILNQLIAKHSTYPNMFLPPASEVGRVE